MKLCSRCRQRRDGADVRLSYQTETNWICWACIARISRANGNAPPYGECCHERPENEGRSISCSCPVYHGSHGTISSGYSVGRSVSHGLGRSISTGVCHTESFARGFTRSSTVPELGFTDGSGI